MKNLKESKRKRILGSFLIVFLLILIIASSGQLAARPCSDGLARCGVDAGMAGIFGGLDSFLYFSSVCLMGYSFCMRYY